MKSDQEVTPNVMINKQRVEHRGVHGSKIRVCK